MKVVNLFFGLVLVFIGINNFFLLIEIPYFNYVSIAIILVAGFLIFKDKKLIGFLIIILGLISGAGIFVEEILDYFSIMNILVIAFGFLLLVSVRGKKKNLGQLSSSQANTHSNAFPAKEVQQVNSSKIFRKKKKVFKFSEYDDKNRIYSVNVGFGTRTATSVMALKKTLEQEYPGYQIEFKW